MINIIKDKYIQLIRKELVRKGLIEDFYVDRDKYPVTVTIKTHLDKRKAKMIAMNSIMCLHTGMFGRVEVNVIKSL
jgi:hypothetical protein